MQMINLLETIHIDNIINFCIVLSIILGFKIFSPIFSRIIILIFHKIFRIKNRVVESSFYSPLKTFFVVTGFYIGIRYLNISAKTISLVNKVYRIIIIMIIAKGLANNFEINSTFLKKLEKRDSFNNEGFNKFVAKILKVLIYIVAGFMIITELGYDLGGLVTGLGVGSAVVALAAQDFVKSVIGGFAIITDKPFEIGDFIETDKYQGTVIDITFRSVRIKATDNTVINIPNSIITTSPVINWSKIDKRRFSTTLRISLDSSKEKIEKAVSKVKTVLVADNHIVKNTARVYLDSIESDCNKIIVYAYINTSDYEEYMKYKEEINCNILEVLNSENISLVYPTQKVYTEDG